jgi:hypothetical protein
VAAVACESNATIKLETTSSMHAAAQLSLYPRRAWLRSDTHCPLLLCLSLQCSASTNALLSSVACLIIADRSLSILQRQNMATKMQQMQE